MISSDILKVKIERDEWVPKIGTNSGKFNKLSIFLYYSYLMDDKNSSQPLSTDSIDQANLRDSEFVWEPKGSEMQSQLQQQGADSVITGITDMFQQSWSGDGGFMLRQSLDSFRRDSIREMNLGDASLYSSNYGFLQGSNLSYFHAADRPVTT